MRTNKKEAGAADFTFEGKRVSFPVYEGSRGERALDISALRRETGLVTYDPGLVNTGICSSDITFVDGEKGLVLHRGCNIEDLAEQCMFLEVAYLLIMGKLPTLDEQSKFSSLMNEHSLIHEDMQHFFRNYPEHAHPMAVLSAMVVSLSSFYPEMDTESVTERIDNTVARLLSKVRTLAAFSYKKFIGEPFVYPSYKLRYCENFLNMMFSSPVHDYIIDPVVEKALNLFLILHADHEQNCSTTVVRTVGSSGANLYASISAGICALWGPLHGGANQAVIEMLDTIHESGDSVAKVIQAAKSKDSKIRLMGFGHRIYKAYDPRARIAKKACKSLLEHLRLSDPLLDIAVELEEAALRDPYFQEKNLYPNVDFYTGIAYRAMGIPSNMFTVIFAIGRLPGWIAQWLENSRDAEQKLMRPRQIYTGIAQQVFVNTKDR
ncbi:MAG: citrate synthase [Spirochaetales bacterium]|jgi:citrate synthase|nr:citrate synthase [Spirochaetales bacterium]